MDNHTINSAKSGVTQSLTLELIDATGAATPMQADLSYDPRDPYAVTAVFMTGFPLSGSARRGSARNTPEGESAMGMPRMSTRTIR